MRAFCCNFTWLSDEHSMARWSTYCHAWASWQPEVPAVPDVRRSGGCQYTTLLQPNTVRLKAAGLA